MDHVDSIKQLLNRLCISTIANRYSNQRKKSLQAVVHNYRKSFVDGEFTLRTSFQNAVHLSFLTTLSPTALFITATIFIFGWGLFAADILFIQHGFVISFVCAYLIGRIAGHIDANIAQPMLNYFGFQYLTILFVGCLVSGGSATLLFGFFGFLVSTQFLSMFDAFVVFMTANSIFYLHYAVHHRELVSFASTTKSWGRGQINDLLPFNKRGKIISLSALGHYVNVQTENGEHEIRMKFSEALNLVKLIDGLRVHRSHWVAVAEINNLVFKKRRWILRVGSCEIPVSATYSASVKYVIASKQNGSRQL